jgi:hypothetical protein
MLFITDSRKIKGAVVGHNIHTEFHKNQSTGSSLQATMIHENFLDPSYGTNLESTPLTLWNYVLMLCALNSSL